MESILCTRATEERIVSNCSSLVEAFNQGYRTYSSNNGTPLDFGSAWLKLGGQWETEEGCDGCSLQTWWKDEKGEYIFQLTFEDGNGVPLYM